MVITTTTVNDSISMAQLNEMMKNGNSCSVVEQSDGSVMVETGRYIENIMGKLYFAGNVRRVYYTKGIR